MSETLTPRPPIVVIMGHIDHGKTTLLDYIRKSRVALKESGNITQHVGAYEITLPHEGQQKRITFLDTPGHEAFASIRSRGAKLADIAILILAADEGVMPQTKEALFHIKAANIPYIVAINKIDKPGINLEKIKSALAKEEIYLEGRGGDVPCVEISAKDGTNVDQLLELILLISEMGELKADLNKNAEGIVIESRMDPKRGICATLVITDGTLNYGDKINVDTCEGKIKMLEDFQGNNVTKLSFSSPALVVGFECLPTPGTKFICGEITAEQKESLKLEQETYCKTKLVGENPEKVIPVAIKADFVGSCEALVFALDSLAKELNVSFNIIKNNVGHVTETDLKALDNTIETYLICFRVKIDPSLNTFISQHPIKIFSGETIYQILDQMKEAIQTQTQNSGPVKKATFKVSALFNNIKGDQLIGGDVIEGEIFLKDKFKLMRIVEEISTESGEGQVKNIQCSKQNVLHIGSPNECGILVSCETDIQKDDLLEFYK